MTVTSGAAVNEYGPQIYLGGTNTAVADAGFVTGSIVYTTPDNVPFVDILVRVSMPYSIAPTGGIDIFLREHDVFNLEDTPLPANDYLEKYVGSVAIAPAGGPLNLILNGVRVPRKFSLSVQNNSGISTGISLASGTNIALEFYVTPTSYNTKL